MQKTPSTYSGAGRSFVQADLLDLEFVRLCDVL